MNTLAPVPPPPPPPPPMPTSFAVLPFRPNPSSGPVDVRLALPEERPVRVAIYDLSGRLVRRLADGDVLPAGDARIPWDGRDGDGSIVQAGVYIVDVHAGRDSGVRRLVRFR